MNPFTNPALVASYERWYDTAGRRADRLEKALLTALLAGIPTARTLLEVGCGSGHFTRWFADHAVQTAGLDVSRPMLLEATRLNHMPYVRGDAAALPFVNRSFDLVTLITTLEFVPDPVAVLAEAIRVAGQGLILGVLNRQSVLGWQLRRAGGPVWEAARFYTPAEMIRLVHTAASRPVGITWQTTLWPLWTGALPLPWGGFIGMVVKWDNDDGGRRP
ncbi:MAG: class I SAM-dependent methyltransferase [Anaerolineae bacterium]|nr:class I SAM-dependent methyltransferase [Anaerolineae bacterium]